MRIHLLTLVFAALLINAPLAYSTSSIESLLSNYNVSSTMMSTLRFTNMSYSNSSYVALYTGSTLFMVMNVTGSQPSILLNASQIFNVIKGTMLQNSLASADFPSLSALMHRYQSSSAGPINECLALTGLSRGLTCTLANMCQSCLSVPSCGTYQNNPLWATGGPTGVFAQGIMQFGSAYSSLNSSYLTFYSLLSNINSSNEVARIALLNSALSTISNITLGMYQNPIFPPTANITSQQFGACSNYLSGSAFTSNVAAIGAPWYCNAIGYCPFLTFNYTLISLISSRMSAIMHLPITDSQIMSVATNASNTASRYVMPIVHRQKTAQLNQILNTTLLNYSSFVNSTESLLTHISNQTLLSRLSAMKSVYSNVTSNYLNLNLTGANRSLSSSLAALKTVYNSVNSTYSKILGLAGNNTALIIESQLNSRGADQQTTNLAFIELAYNNAANGRISNITDLESRLSAMSQLVKSVYSSSLPMLSATELSRAVDGAFVRAIAPSLNLNYASAVSLAPALSSLLSLIIGVIALAVVLVFYLRLKARKKLALSRRTRRNWHRVFIIVIAAVVVYVLATYAYASGANGFAPSSAFLSALHSARSIVVGINGTPTSSQVGCANLLVQRAKALYKQPVLVHMGGGVCMTGNSTKNLSSCMSFYSANNIPIVILTNSNSRTGMSLYSFYGTHLSVTGNSTYMQSCYPSLLLR